MLVIRTISFGLRTVRALYSCEGHWSSLQHRERLQAVTQIDEMNDSFYLLGLLLHPQVRWNTAANLDIEVPCLLKVWLPCRESIPVVQRQRRNRKGMSLNQHPQ
eukprot:3682839-Rhodomonas_salina.1